MSGKPFEATLDKVLGVLALGATAYLGWAAFSSEAGIMHFVFGLLVLLGISALFGLRSDRRARKSTMSAAALKQIVSDREVPFSVCTECRIVIELPHAVSCPECGSTDRCVAVAEEEDRSIALSAVGSDD